MTPDIVKETEEITEGKVIYEQDLRAGTNRNGRAPHMVEPTVDGPSGPTDVEEEHRHLPDRPPAQRLLVGVIYLGAGSLLIYAGVVVLRDWKNQNKEKK